MHKRINVGAVTLGAIWLASCVVAYSQYAYASRNSSGSYSTPNTFTAGSVISSSAMNANFSDLATEMTDSLDRSGKGGMLAALRGIDGTVAAPALSFTNESGTGWYRVGSNNPALSVNGTKRFECTATGCITTGTGVVSGAATLQSTLAVTGASTLTGGVTGSLTVDQAGANTASSLTNGLKFGGTSSTEGIGSNRSGIGANTNGLDLITGGTTRLQVASGGAITSVGTFTIGSSGTAVSASYGSSYTINFGAISSGTCSTSSQSLTGVAVGGVCNVSVDGNLGGAFSDCYVSAGNTVIVRACAITSGINLGSGSYRVRVWQP